MLISCGKYAGGLIDLARGQAQEAREQRALLRHVEGCAECARRLDEQRALHAGLQRLAAEEHPAGDAIEAQVLARFDNAPRSRTKGGVARWALAAGMAAVVCLGALWTLRWAPAERPAVTASHRDAPFLTIPYTIPLAPEERTEMVRMRIPVTALRAAGFHVQVSDPSAAVDADVLIGQDGRARAIRPLSIAISN